MNVDPTVIAIAPVWYADDGSWVELRAFGRETVLRPRAARELAEQLTRCAEQAELLGRNRGEG